MGGRRTETVLTLRGPARIRWTACWSFAMKFARHLPLLIVTVLAGTCLIQAQTPPPGGSAAAGAGKQSDLELGEKLLVARRDYQRTLEQLRAHYYQVGDQERGKWAEEELIQYHRVPKQAFRLELEL